MAKGQGEPCPRTVNDRGSRFKAFLGLHRDFAPLHLDNRPNWANLAGRGGAGARSCISAIILRDCVRFANWAFWQVRPTGISEGHVG